MRQQTFVCFTKIELSLRIGCGITPNLYYYAKLFKQKKFPPKRGALWLSNKTDLLVDVLNLFKYVIIALELFFVNFVFFGNSNFASKQYLFSFFIYSMYLFANRRLFFQGVNLLLCFEITYLPFEIILKVYRNGNIT